MAEPIKETPVLTGKNARRFEKEIAHPIPESREEIEKARKIYELVKANGELRR